uniref:Cytochrome P450 monooxygenase CYP367A1 n=1 Tax=Ostrinia furnacalis TaxID=93504 RepID=A0A7S9CEF2_OSTFU|nr:cytochrome P450 monooxygenase CYP367A1 [Ostrinia furnacalis]
MIALSTAALAVSIPALVYWLLWRFRYRRMLRLAASVPGPPALPVLGNALMFLTNTTEQLQKITNLFDVYGEYIRLWLGPELTIAVKNAADIRLLLSSNKINQKGPLYETLKPFIGPGILSGGPTWRPHRKVVTPSYNKKSVQQFSRIFNIEAELLVRGLRTKGPDTYDIFYDVLNCTTQCVCQTLMGLSKEESIQIPQLNEIVLKTQGMYNMIFKKMIHWWLQIPFIYWLTGHKKLEDYYSNLIDRLTGYILEKRRTALKVEGAVEEDLKSVVDRLIESGELSDREIKYEMFTLFTTSQEAAAKIASGVLMMLAHLPDWQKKVYDEIQTVVGMSAVTEGHLKELLYLDMVYKETLRYFSIAAFIQRTVQEEITINDGKITLPVGTSLIIPIHSLHRDPKHWEEPLKAKPERFLLENVKKRDPNAFIPFSLGPMDCLGRVFATAMIKTIVVHVIRNMHLEADGVMDDIPLEVAISVRSANGYLVRSKLRKQNGVKVNGVGHK